MLAGEPLPDDAAAALRQGAFALYGACSATEVRTRCPLLGSRLGLAVLQASARHIRLACRNASHPFPQRCLPPQIQFLYASLGGAAAGGSGQRGGAGAAASWRAALSALKGEYERSGRYSGKV